MSADGEPINNPEVVKRVEVDRVKGLIKQDNLIFRGHDVDNPGPNDLDGKESELIRSFGLEKVETVQQLFDSLKDSNRGHDAPKEKLDILATAICESMIESGRSDIVIAGSSSVEKQLSLTGFSGKDKDNEEDRGFAFMVAEKFRERFRAGETRESVTSTMEYLDYIKNSAYGGDGGLEEAANEAYKLLLQTKPNVLSQREMQARAAVLRYVSGLKGEKPVSTDEGNSQPREESSEDGEEELGYLQAQDRLLQAKHEAALDAGEKSDYRTPVWLLSYPDLVDEEMTQRGKQQVRMDPPYPEWYKKLPRRERDLRKVRAKLLNGVAWKQMIRNKDVDKLMSNEAIDINKHELKLLMEMPHVEDAMRLMFSELLEVSDKQGDSKNLLRIKRDRKADGTTGRDLDPAVENLLVHFENYKEKLALRMQFPKETGESELGYEKRIDGLYEDHDFFDGKEVVKIERNKKGQELTRIVWEGGNKTKEGMDFRAAVGVAWEFLYIGNILESADEDRLLKPSEPISDKLRSMMHPLAKAMAKWGIYKGDKEGHKGVFEEDEKRGKYDMVTGEEEPMGGPIAAWVLYHLEMDEVKNRKYKDSFRYKLLKRESGYRPLPKRMASSAVEMLEVYCEDENHNLVVGEDGKPKTIFLSEALMDRKHKITFDVVKLKEREVLKNGNLGDNIIMTKTRAEQEGRDILGHEYDGHEHDIFVPFRDCMDGCKTAFDYLTASGRIKYDPKDPATWSLAFMKDIDLIRQNAVKYDSDGKKSYLRFVDNPEFIAWVVASSVGFDHRSEKIRLDRAKTYNNNRAYYYAVKSMVDLPGLVKLGIDKESIMEYLSATGGPYRTESYINGLDRQIQSNDKKRKNKGFNYVHGNDVDGKYKVKKEDEDF